MPLHPWVADRARHLHAMPALGGFSTEAGQAEWRAYSRADEYVAPDVAMREEMLPRDPAAGPPVRALVYRPAVGEPSGAGLVWAHGGGFTGGDAEMFEADGVARELVDRTGGVVVSVDYRLAGPAVHAPAPFDDVRRAWEWALERSADLGIDAGRLALGGASAGAALAAGVAVALRDDGVPLPARLILAYPKVHPVLPPFAHELAAKLPEIPDVLNYAPGEGHDGSLVALLGGPVWWTTSHIMAGLADPTGLPRTFVLNSEYDALRASGQEFAAQLARAGVDVAVRNEPGVLHGHLNLPPVLQPVDDSLQAIADHLLR